MRHGLRASPLTPARCRRPGSPCPTSSIRRPGTSPGPRACWSPARRWSPPGRPPMPACLVAAISISLSLVVTAGGCAGRQVHRRPVRHVVALDAGLVDRRHVRRRRQALGAAGGQCAHLAAVDLRHREVGASANIKSICPPIRSVMRGRPALVRDVVHLDAGHLAQHLGRHAAGRAAAGELDLSRRWLGRSTILAQRLGRHV